MRYAPYLTFLLAGVLCISSCKENDSVVKEMVAVDTTFEVAEIPDSIRKEEFKNWHETAPGYAARRESNHFTFIATYTPPELLALNELNDTDRHSTAIPLDTVIDQYSGSYYFTFEIDDENGEADVLKSGLPVGESPEKNSIYEKRVAYFSYEMNKDLAFVVDKDTFRCVLHHFERTFGLSGKLKISIAFDKGATIKENSRVSIVYKDPVYTQSRIELPFDPKLFLKKIKII